MGILVSLLVLSFLIFFHELGHFLAARFFGVKVEVFSIGFGKKIYKKMHKGTEYCISSIPLGGYVQMKGQDDTDPTKRSSDTDSYNTKESWKRVIILFAGPFANFLLAFLLYIAIAFIGVSKYAPIIGTVYESSPAYEAGLKTKDKILSINDQKITTWDDLSILIKNSTGNLLFAVKRESEIKNILLKPKIREMKNLFGEKIQRRAVGISPTGDVVILHYGFLESFSYAYKETLNATNMIVLSLQKLIEGVIPAKELGGVVSIVQITSQASAAGLAALFGLTALISVNLGILNLLPIPALDGGHIIFNLYEMIFKRPPNENILYKLTVGGWVFLISLMIFTLFNDIIRISGM